MRRKDDTKEGRKEGRYEGREEGRKRRYQTTGRKDDRKLVG